MRRLYYTPEALTDLQTVRETVLERFGSPDLANQILREIMKKIRSLEVFPMQGPELELSFSEVSEYRYLFVKKNYVFYRIEGEQIRIVRILNEKREFMRILFGISETEQEEEMD